MRPHGRGCRGSGALGEPISSATMGNEGQDSGDYADESADIPPPWQQFPTYERYSIGWRMGVGEECLIVWHAFLDTLDSTDLREAYLRRHDPAPVSWAGVVYEVLHPSEPDYWDSAAGVRKARVAEVVALGFARSDAAFHSWQKSEPDYRPWECHTTPEEAARYGTRAFWFWSRREADRSSDTDYQPPVLPRSWTRFKRDFEHSTTTAPSIRKGLQTLARMLLVGSVTPPWELGLGPEDANDSFESDMNYVDAYRLWGHSCFDDSTQRDEFLLADSIPTEWQEWCHNNFGDLDPG